MMNDAVERAITCIWERYEEQLSLADIAESAKLSRFHFSRTFKECTGVSPFRFLSAVRMYHAKRMLATTPAKVTDTAFAVGYNSLGSFTNHFTNSVGLSPSRFRRLGRDGRFEAPDMPRTPSRQGCQVSGRITVPSDSARARVYLGVFSSPIMECRPVVAGFVDVASPDRPAEYRLAACVPEGTWYVHAVAVVDSLDPEPWTRRTVLVNGGQRLTTPACGVLGLDITLRPRRKMDLPILLALRDLAPELTAGAAAGHDVERHDAVQHDVEPAASEMATV
jgi:AraC-like DNA-binding protein